MNTKIVLLLLVCFIATPALAAASSATVDWTQQNIEIDGNWGNSESDC